MGWWRAFSSVFVLQGFLFGVWAMSALGQTPLEVQGTASVAIEIVAMNKRPLKAGELPSGTVRGVRWEYTLRFKDQAGIGVEIDRLVMKVTADSKPLTSAERWFPLRVDAGGAAEAYFSASIATSVPDQPGELSGVHELLLEGRNGRDEAVAITIRVPLK